MRPRSAPNVSTALNAVAVVDGESLDPIPSAVAAATLAPRPIQDGRFRSTSHEACSAEVRWSSVDRSAPHRAACADSQPVLCRRMISGPWSGVDVGLGCSAQQVIEPNVWISVIAAPHFVWLVGVTANSGSATEVPENGGRCWTGSSI